MHVVDKAGLAAVCPDICVGSRDLTAAEAIKFERQYFCGAGTSHRPLAAQLMILSD